MRLVASFERRKSYALFLGTRRSSQSSLSIAPQARCTHTLLGCCVRCTISTDKSNQVVKAAQNLAVHTRERDALFLLPANKMLSCCCCVFHIYIYIFVSWPKDATRRGQVNCERAAMLCCALTNKLAIELLPGLCRRRD
jgi:hypothetical protein